MQRRSLSVLTLVLLIGSVLPFAALAELSVGVKPNDWAEYDVSFTGTPMTEHDAEWARMEVDSVEGGRINVTFSSLLSDGSLVNVTENLDFEAGQLIDYFIIPAGLMENDTFYSIFGGEEGIVKIDEVATRTYAGAARTVISGKTPETLWFWDQRTGVLVEAQSIYPNFTLTTIIEKTGLWEPQIFGFDPPTFYGIVISFSIAIVIFAILLVQQRKRR